MFEYVDGCHKVCLEGGSSSVTVNYLYHFEISCSTEKHRFEIAWLLCFFEC
jgi:hypothetical protein